MGPGAPPRLTPLSVDLQVTNTDIYVFISIIECLMVIYIFCFLINNIIVAKMSYFVGRAVLVVNNEHI